MPERRRPRRRDRARGRDRHGRGLRSSVAGPALPFLRTRADAFEDIVVDAVEHLRSAWPDELAGVVVEVAVLPDDPRPHVVPRWRVDHAGRRVVLYRLPVERLGPRADLRDEPDDGWRHRVRVEGTVLRAVGELLGRDPWDLAPDRWQDD